MLILLTIIFLCIFYLVLLRRPKPNKNFSLLGKEAIKNKNLLLCTCVRDAENNVKNIKRICKYFSRYFNKVKLLVMENDSKDKTRSMLLNLRKYIDIDVVGCGINSPVCNMNLNNIRTGHSNKRFRRMAIIRNVLLDHIKQIQSDYDYCIVFDGDMDMKIDTYGFLESMYYLEHKKRINAISCYGLGFASLLTLNKIYDGIAYKPMQNENMINLLTTFRLNELTKVKSSFNGLCVYKLPFAEDIKYNERTNECEHISFNKYFNMYLNPKFVIEFDRWW
jgi:hypothetical protein